jgi:hypothetical protein
MPTAFLKGARASTEVRPAPRWTRTWGPAPSCPPSDGDPRTGRRAPLTSTSRARARSAQLRASGAQPPEAARRGPSCHSHRPPWPPTSCTLSMLTLVARELPPASGSLAAARNSQNQEWPFAEVSGFAASWYKFSSPAARTTSCAHGMHESPFDALTLRGLATRHSAASVAYPPGGVVRTADGVIERPGALAAPLLFGRPRHRPHPCRRLFLLEDLLVSPPLWTPSPPPPLHAAALCCAIVASLAAAALPRCAAVLAAPPPSPPPRLAAAALTVFATRFAAAALAAAALARSRLLRACCSSARRRVFWLKIFAPAAPACFM